MKYLSCVYLFFALMSMGHWFATEYNYQSDNESVRNPASSLFVALIWPSYVSYQLFK